MEATYQESEVQSTFNVPPRSRQELVARQQQPVANIKHEYKYLKPSERIKTGFWKEEFDLRFTEIKDSMVTKGMLTVLTTFYPEVNKYLREHPNQKRQPEQQDHQELQRELKLLKPNFTTTTDRDIRYTWIGHSTAVIQVGPDNLIIDPVFSTRASPVQFIGPKRFRPPACSIPQLPKIDVALISHDHYDHLDEAALNELQKCFKPLFVAGIGSIDVMPKKANLRLMDWMEKVNVVINSRPYNITFVPVVHWSKRGMNDLNTRLWGGFVIETPFNQKIFYSGDTGYSDVFKEIGHMFGPFDLTILPIGAYEPRHLLRPQHINPEEACIIHKELRSKQSVGVHWGTFPLGAEGYFQAKYDLAEARKKQQLDDNQFITIYHGQSVIFEKDKKFKR